ncbi:calcium-translocating P-type ATPase, SERCA-type [Laceyella sacchari]|uniref:Calcium-translocating P-type ATPase, SERCA-type n=1 Tax=Laceyella sacchari TaxID=37482 RepID=A0ABY5U6G1_LACSH|nr:calcium-translocating P-type ATPase, SERCA-type [Laceyella sacchari]UWE05234.1 calcium-translocating P-type ATPase, SERCA-type [Laceyella sacchari]
MFACLSEYIVQRRVDKGGRTLSERARWVDWEVERVAAHFKVDLASGLSDKEAKERLKQVGPNQLAEGEKASWLSLFIEQFKDFMVLVLLIATLISGLLGEYTDAIAIIAIVLLNAVLGFIQEMRAEKSLSALKKLSAPTAKVLREGEWKRVDASQLVPGDVIMLESGDRIPADVRFAQTEGLYVEESALTGESVPVTKQSSSLPRAEVALGDRKNMGYMGTMVVRGNGLGIVVHTGMATEMGRIAHLLENTETMDTPLKRRLEQLGKVLIVVALLLTALVVFTGILHGHDAYKMFLAGVSLAVAAIPEGLPAIVTIALALGVQRMIKRRAIVRKLPSVETLGCATVICSDKTGTLTQNKMSVTHLWADGKRIQVSGSGYVPEGEFQADGATVKVEKEPALRRLLEVAALCNNAQLIQKTEKNGLLKKSEAWVVNGDPTEGALLVAAAKAGLDKEHLAGEWERIKELPFDSERKMMSVILENKSKGRVVFSKGAPDVLLTKCTHLLEQGRKVPLTDAKREQILRHNEELASMALRNLGFAYRELDSRHTTLKEGQYEQQLVFVGLAGMIDPPRAEVKEAINVCRKAGIKTVMITGDHQTTAVAIARELGIKRPQGLTLTGQDLYNMSDDEFQKKVNDVDVYARVSPEHKLRIVKALQQAGQVVAMTGDGVNDAPAIKSADIGIAMGITGTDVSKEASSLILADDNFSTIVAAVEEGRNIYENIRKFISYLLASNVGEILIMFLAMLAGLPLPLVPIQILWVNLVTDGLPAMALGIDPAEEDTMVRSPRNSRESVFARGVGWKIVTRGLLIGASSLMAFWVTYLETPDDLVRAQTVAFATLVFAQLIYVFDCRSQGTIFQRTPLDNLPLVLAVLSSAVLLLAVIYYPPLQPVFHTVSLGVREWILVIVTSTLPVILAGILDLLRPMARRTQRMMHSS